MADSAAGNIIQILASLPDFLRKPMMQGRVREFFTMSEENKRETIAMALEAAPGIGQDKLAVLVQTWLEVVSELEPAKRSELFGVYAGQVLARRASVQRLNFESLVGAFQSLGAEQQAAITDSLHETLFSLPKRQEIISLLPEQALRALKLRV